MESAGSARVGVNVPTSNFQLPIRAYIRVWQPWTVSNKSASKKTNVIVWRSEEIIWSRLNYKTEFKVTNNDNSKSSDVIIDVSEV